MYNTRTQFRNDLKRCSYVNTKIIEYNCMKSIEKNWGTINVTNFSQKKNKNIEVACVQPSTSYKPLKTMKWVKDKFQVLGQSLAEQRGKSAGLYP